MSAAIDYVAEALKRRPGPKTLGIPELVDMDNAILGGERSAAQIAEDLGVTSRTVQRRRALLRARGLGFEVPEMAEDPWGRVNAARERRRRG